MTHLMLGHQLPIIQLFLWEDTDSNSRGMEGTEAKNIYGLFMCCCVLCSKCAFPFVSLWLCFDPQTCHASAFVFPFIREQLVH